MEWVGEGREGGRESDLTRLIDVHDDDDACAENKGEKVDEEDVVQKTNPYYHCFIHIENDRRRRQRYHRTIS